MRHQNLLLFAVLLCLPLPAADKKLNANFLFAFGEKGESPGQFNQPRGVAADANGNIYVTDTGNNRLQKFSPTGKLLVFNGGFGWGKNQFQYPVDVFVYNSLDIYIADYENNRIERYDKDLNWLTSYYSNPNWETNYQFEFPNSVCLGLHGNFFVVDSQNDRIIKLNVAFEPEISFGGYDWGEGALEEGSDVFVSLNDNIYVTDTAAHKILVYDYFGNYTFAIGGDMLAAPKGLCADEMENIFVADAKSCRIFAFDQTGRPILELGAPGEKMGAFAEPADVAVMRNRLYVADTQNNRIQVFELLWEK